MNKFLSTGFILICLACTTANKPLTTEEKDKVVNETKVLVSTIFQACESCDPNKLTATYVNSPDFVALINGKFFDYEQVVKEYPVLMSYFKTQKATITSEKYAVLDASTVLYTANSNWECKLQNDSIAQYDSCTLELLLKNVGNEWKVLSWTEAY